MGQFRISWRVGRRDRKRRYYRTLRREKEREKEEGEEEERESVCVREYESE